MREPGLGSVGQRSRNAILGIIGADDLLGTEVVDRDGNVVGQLHDILLDLRRNRIGYGVIELRRARRDGERLVAIPWNALFQDGDADRFSINAPRDRIEDAPLLPVRARDQGARRRRRSVRPLVFRDTALLGTRRTALLTSTRRHLP